MIIINFSERVHVLSVYVFKRRCLQFLFQIFIEEVYKSSRIVTSHHATVLPLAVLDLAAVCHSPHEIRFIPLYETKGQRVGII
jgi:hypothetical protein